LRLFQSAKLVALNLENSGERPQTVQDFTLLFAKRFWAKCRKIDSKGILKLLLEPISKIVDHAQGQGANRFKSGAYTLVFEHFETVYAHLGVYKNRWAIHLSWITQ
jgi:hypothetical protein